MCVNHHGIEHMESHDFRINAFKSQDKNLNDHGSKNIHEV